MIRSLLICTRIIGTRNLEYYRQILQYCTAVKYLKDYLTYLTRRVPALGSFRSCSDLLASPTTMSGFSLVGWYPVTWSGAKPFPAGPIRLNVCIPRMASSWVNSEKLCRSHACPG